MPLDRLLLPGVRVAGDLGNALDPDRGRLRAALGERFREPPFDLAERPIAVACAIQHRIDAQLSPSVDDPVLGQRCDPRSADCAG